MQVGVAIQKWWRFLVAKGADVHAEGKYGDTPLHYASDERDNLKAVEFLVANGADVNAKGRYGYTPLHYAFGYGYAFERGNLEMVKLLVAKGADVYAEDDCGRTPEEYQEWLQDRDDDCD